MNDQLQVDLHDAELRAEIEMTTDLMIAAAGAPGRLSDDTVDGILGLRASSGRPHSSGTLYHASAVGTVLAGRYQPSGSGRPSA